MRPDDRIGEALDVSYAARLALLPHFRFWPGRVCRDAGEARPNADLLAPRKLTKFIELKAVTGAASHSASVSTKG